MWFMAAGVKRHLTYFMTTLDRVDLARELGPRRRITTLVSAGSTRGLRLIRTQFDMTMAKSVMAANVRWLGGKLDTTRAQAFQWEAGRPSLQFPPIALGRGTPVHFPLDHGDTMQTSNELKLADWPMGSHPDYFFTVAVRKPSYAHILS